MKLEKEYQTYLEHKDELLAKSEGKFVLIKDTKIIDVYSSYEDALKEGFKRFGNVPFLVKEIQREEEINFFYTNVAA
ncbi:MAG: hypothetical protein HY447_03695 [Candidatus Omnitrophica bacterium]|nr:hypothetical protein [Candidatus Omnitrophota bacterium]